MRRPVFRRSATGMALFPFLAVLICTMGALIVLLVMVLQQARVQATAAAVEESRAREATRSAAKAQKDEKLEQIREDLEWRQELLQQQRTSQSEELAKQRLELSHLEDHIRRLEDQWKQTLKKLQELQKVKENKEATEKASRDQLVKLQQEIEAAKREYEEARRKAFEKPPSFALVPYVGKNGVRRRPIYIECTEEGIVLHPERVVFLPADFNGPLGPGNPLDAALRTVREYWARTSDPRVDGEPYPLLIVRPNGAVAYAMARGAMKSWDEEFGYELVDDELRLEFPPPDPELDTLLTRTIKDARERQTLLAAAMPSRYKNAGADGLVASPNGGFAAAPYSGDTSTPGVRGGGGGVGGAARGPGGRGGVSGGSGMNGSSGGFGGPGGPGDGDGFGGDSLGGGGAQFASTGVGGSGTGGGFGAGSGGPGAVGGSGGNSGGGAGGGAAGQGGAGGSGGPSGSGGPNGGAAGGGAAGGMAGGNTGGGFGSGGGGGRAGGSVMPIDPNSDPTGGSPFGPNGPGGGSGRSGGSSGATGNTSTGGSSGRGSSGGGSSGGGSASGGANSGGASGGSRGGSATSGSAQGGAASGGTSGSSDGSGGGSVSTTFGGGSIARSKGHDWALPNKTQHATGITRPIRIRCMPDRLVIVPERGDDQRPKTVMLKEQRVRASVEEFVSAIWKHTDRWGLAVVGGYWKPVLNVEVAPGAEQQFAELETLLRDSGLEVVRK